MPDRTTSMKFAGNAEDLKRALDEVTLKLKQTKLAAQEIKVNADQQAGVKDFFHEMHAGALASTGSLRGMGMAFSSMGSMLPIIALGVLFEALKKLGIFKSMFEDITDAIGITNHALEKSQKIAELLNTGSIAVLENQIKLLKARGVAVDEINNAEIALARKEAEAAYKKLQDDFEAGKWDSKKAELAKKNGKDELDYLAKKANYEALIATDNRKTYEDGVNYQNQTRLLKESGLKRDLDEINIWYEAESKKYPTSYALFLLYEAKLQAARDKAVRENANAIKEVKGKFTAGETLWSAFLGSGKDVDPKKLIEPHLNVLKEIPATIKEISKSLSEGADSWVDYGKAIGNVARKYIAEQLAMAVASMIKTQLEEWGWTGPGAIIAAGVGAGIATTAFRTLIPNFASGTGFAPGGMAMVGEHGPELVNLPRGSQVIPNNKLGQNLHIIVSGKFSGRDIYFAGEQYYELMNNNT